jgi:hypothetical protein
VRVDFSKLTESELSIADALDGIFLQYHWGSPLESKAFEALNWYDLYCHEDGKFIPSSVRFSELHKILGSDSISFRKTEKFRGNLQLSVDDLNQRSVFCLLLLAKFVDQHLKYEDTGVLHHEHMSSGEGAFAELRAYGFLECAENGWGKWSELGIEAVRIFPELGDFPGWSGEPDV